MSALVLLLMVAEVEVLAPSEVAFGKAFELTVIRRWSSGLDPEPWQDALLRPLAVKLVDRQQGERAGVVQETLRFHAYAFERSAVVLAGVTFTAHAADGTERSDTADPKNIIVESSLDGAAPGPVELPGGPVEVPFRWSRWTIEFIGVLAGVGACLWLLRRARRGRRAAASRQSADVRALRRLAAASSLKAAPFYVAVSDAVRDYISERFEVHAPEMTTQEFLASPAVSGAIGEQRRDGLGEFLFHCDHVKFGRLPTTAADREIASIAAERFIHDATIGVSTEVAR